MDYVSKKSKKWEWDLHHWTFHFFFEIDPWNFDSSIFNTLGNWAVPEKIQTEERLRTWNFHRGIKEKACGNSRDQLKKVEFPGVFMKK